LVDSAREEKMTNEKLYQAADEAITALFSDRSVSRAKARENLEKLKDEIDVMIDSLERDEEEDLDGHTK
jgi:hypothetical protein